MKIRLRALSFLPLLALLLCAYCATAQPWLDRLEDALSFQSKNSVYSLQFSGLIDIEGYYIDQRPPGLIYGDDQDFINPRLSLFVDAHAGKHLYSFVQFRFDRGFDPRSEIRQARFDEYLLRYTPFDEPVLNLQVGKFATVVGNWVQRHLSWDNPFINAPLPYENIAIVSDQLIVPGTPAFLRRQQSPDNKPAWLPIIWGPDYASGASVFGSIAKFDYAFEIKNAALASHPELWDARDIGWENPTFSGRLGLRPATEWNLGTSFSYGHYLSPEAEDAAAFPSGKSIGDFHQLMVGSDLSYAWHHLQLWAELFLSRFEVPNVGDADTLAYYVEAKYKITPQLFAALRWNQQFFAQIPNGTGAEVPWDRDIWRIDSALGFRFTRHLQAKVQYSFSDQRGSLQQGQQLVAAQLTCKF